MNEQQITRLNQTDLAAIEKRVQYELDSLGEYPTVAALEAEGYHENRLQTRALDWISGAGRVLTLFIAEFVQAFAALALAVVFILLEAERINAGVIALGQHAEQAVLIALAFTSANFLLPIYRLRAARNQARLIRTRATARGYLGAFWRRLVFKPQEYEVEHYHNPTLAVTEGAITWATLFLAFYAVLGPILTSYEALPWYQAIGAVIAESSFTEMLGLAAGALLAVGGVFGVQSISHELGVRTLTDQPARLADVLATRRADYEHRKAELRDRITAEHMAAKIADDQRKQAAKAQQRAATVEVEPVTVRQEDQHENFLAAQTPTPHRNGNGKHGAGDGIEGV